MPEIAEVYRAADYIRQHLVGRTIATIKAQHDENVFGKVGTSGAAIEKALLGKKIVGAGSQGKYFWITMSSPPHLLCHFGMNGWFHIKGIPTFYYKDTKKDRLADKDWPPRNWKFWLQTKPEGKDETVLDAAFVDSRRFGRVRLMDCAAEDLRKISPLVDNGPDPNTDKHIVTRDWLAALCRRKRVPIKALLLDQANISGIGNWVGDEILYQARMHPEQYSNTLSDEQLTELHKQLMIVVDIAIETRSDSDKFPKTWLFKHRWGKGRKSVYEMPNGDEITYLTVGGRTSAIVPTLQKKTGPVAGDLEDDAPEKASNSTKASRKRKKINEDIDEDVVDDEEAAKEENIEAEPESTEAKSTSNAEPKPRTKRGKTSNDAAEPPAKRTKATKDTTQARANRSKSIKPKSKDNVEKPTQRVNSPQAPHNKRLKRGGLLKDSLPAEQLPIDEPEIADQKSTKNAVRSRRTRKSNPRLPAASNAEELQTVLDKSNALHGAGRARGRGKDVKGENRTSEDESGRRRSRRISGKGV